MAKKLQPLQTIPSWYPTPEDVTTTQRSQMAASKQAAADFASQAFHPSTAPWWRRIFGLR